MKGIELPDEDEETGGALTGEDVIRRAKAKAMGKDPETMELEDIGFHIEVEE